jgi:hypothetical protein
MLVETARPKGPLTAASLTVLSAQEDRIRAGYGSPSVAGASQAVCDRTAGPKRPGALLTLFPICTLQRLLPPACKRRRFFVGLLRLYFPPDFAERGGMTSLPAAATPRENGGAALRHTYFHSGISMGSFRVLKGAP